MQILFNKTIEPAPPPIPGPPTAGGPPSRADLGNRPPGQLAPGRAVSLAGRGLRSRPGPPRALMPEMRKPCVIKRSFSAVVVRRAGRLHLRRAAAPWPGGRHDPRAAAGWSKTAS